MQTEKIKTIDGCELMDLELPPIRFVVDKILPQGFHILAGAPKVGKSWLLLFLCLQVAKGEQFWDYPTEQGTVLYLCLEDNNNRLQDRLLELTDEVTANIHFATMAHSLSEDLPEQLEMFITDYPNTVLIVIDTLQKIRQANSGSSTYANDYKDIGLLKRIADKHGIAIIGVQHLRKQYDSDPHQMVSGSTGLMGAADGSYILKKEKITDKEAKLYIRGRDVEECIFSLCFNSETMLWDFISSNNSKDETLKNDRVMDDLISLIKREIYFRGTASEIAEKLGSKVKGNVLTRKLRNNEKELQDIGITYTKSRSGERRELILQFRKEKTNDDMTIISAG